MTQKLENVNIFSLHNIGRFTRLGAFAGNMEVYMLIKLVAETKYEREQQADWIKKKKQMEREEWEKNQINPSSSKLLGTYPEVTKTD